MKLFLPYPVSANAYWAKRGYLDKKTRKPMALVYVTEEARAYRSLVGWTAKEAGWRTPTDRLIEIGSIILVPPATRMRRDAYSKQLVEIKNSQVLDLDNALKVTFDALNGIVYEDDAQIKRIRGPIEYGEPQGKGALVIEIEEFIPPPAPIFAAAEASA